MPEPERPRVLIVDDYPGLHAALMRLLTPSCQIVGQMSDAVDLFETATRLQPDVILLDFSMPGLNVLELCRRFVKGLQPVKVIILTAVDDLDVKNQCLAAGASGFVDKLRLTRDLLPAIEYATASPDRGNNVL